MPTRTKKTKKPKTRRTDAPTLKPVTIQHQRKRKTLYNYFIKNYDTTKQNNDEYRQQFSGTDITDDINTVNKFTGKIIIIDNGANLFLYYASNTSPGSVWRNINGILADVQPV